VGKEQQIIEELLALVRSDRYPVGSALPPERKLAQTFHTSRNTVRNAIRSLEARGLLQVRSGSGCYLLAKEDLYEPWRAAVGALSSKELEDLFEARYVFEPVIGAYAAERIDGERLCRLEACVVRLSQAIIAGDTGEIISGDFEFRNEIALATGNSLFRVTFGQLRPTQKVCGEVFAFLSEPQRDAAFADYVEVLNSIKLGDGRQTADLLRRNILRLCGFVIQYTDTPMPTLITGAIGNLPLRPAAAGRGQQRAG
jgi:DNA-binding FadR family transcriptional regulator